MLLASACAPPPGTAWLGLPGDGDEKTMILATRSPEVELSVIAIGGSDRSTTLELGDEPPYRTVYALLYEDDFTRLGYAPGLLPRANSTLDSLTLTPPDRGVFATEVDALGNVSWTSGGPLPPDVRDFPVRASQECALFGAPTLTERVEGRVRFALALDDENVLVRSRDHNIIVDRSGRRDVANPTLDDAYSAFLAPTGDLYIGDVNGRIWRGRPSARSGIEDVTLLVETDLGPIVTIDGGDDDGEIDLLFADAWGGIGHFDGAYQRVGDVVEERPPLVWTGPGKGFLTRRGIALVYAIDNGTLTATNIGASSQVMNLARHELFGVVAGTAEGHFYAYRGLQREWGRIVGADYGWWSISSTPYDDGFAFLLASGFLGTYKRSRGYCEAEPVLQILTDGRVVAVGRDLVVVAVPDESPTTTIVYIPRF